MKVFIHTLVIFIYSTVLSGAGIDKKSTEQEMAFHSSDKTIGFESKFPQSKWDMKRQSARIAGREPVLFLDDTFILGSRNITRSIHAPKKRLNPLSFSVPDNLLKSLTVNALVPASDGDGFFAYCTGGYEDKSLFTIFRTTDGVTFDPVVVDQIPSANIWHDLAPEERPKHNNVLNLNFADDFGMDFPPYYSTFFRVPAENKKPYRAILINGRPRPRKAMILQSTDGLNWERMPNQDIRQVNYEANTPTYDPFHDRYLCYLRLWDPHTGPASRWRKVIFNEALLNPGGIQWTDEVLALAADETDGPATDIYYMQVTGYAGAYIGMPVLYHRPASLNPELVGKFHCELAYSNNGRDWQRICQGQPFITTGPAGSWDAGLIGPSTNPVIINDSLYFYYWGRANTHDEPLAADYRVETGLATLRIDGFVSMDAGQGVGTLVTTPFWPKGKHLYINADASDGEIRVEVLQDYYYVELEKIEKNPDQVKGLFRAENCIPITGNQLVHRVEWENSENFLDSFPKGWNRNLTDDNVKRPFSKRAIALKFYMRNASLYSFWFADEKLPLENGRLVPWQDND